MSSDFLDIIRSNAIYIKLNSDVKSGGGVFIDDMMKVLESLKSSYNSYIEIEFNKSLQIKGSKPSKGALTDVNNDNKLILVDMEFASCNMAIAPDIVTSNNVSTVLPNTLNWKKDKYEQYVDIFLKNDMNSDLFLENIDNIYTPDERRRIYKPLYDGIINNSSIKFKYSIGNKNYDKRFVKPESKIVTFMLLDGINKEVKVKSDNFVKKLAEVQYSEVRNKIKMTKDSISLFDDNIVPHLPISELKVNGHSYVFRFPMYFNCINENDSVILENKEVGLYALGSNMAEATNELAIDFDYMFKRYNELPESQLSDNVKRIKTYLNSIVE